ncbi:MAG: GNAT family N-acetyltransferase [Anaerolineae bacterium]|nr:GNAT family N-acetyltransferase [Anaerolineae bacterium]
METREIKESELDALLDLYAHLHASDDPLPERTVVEAIWEEIQRSPNFQYFGIFVDGRLVSSCTLSIVPNLTRGCRPYGVIENVVTHSDYRRSGYGSTILRYTLERAWGRKCYKVMLLTGRKSQAVYDFYESVGFDGQAKQAFLAKPE